MAELCLHIPVISVMEPGTPKKMYSSLFDTPRRSPRRIKEIPDASSRSNTTLEIDGVSADLPAQTSIDTTPRKASRLVSPNGMRTPTTKISRIARKIIEDSPQSDASPVPRSDCFYKQPKNPPSAKEIRKMLDMKVDRVKKRSRSSSTESSRSHNAAPRHHTARPPSKKRREGINKGVGHCIKKFVPPSASKARHMEQQKAKAKAKHALESPKTFVVTRKRNPVELSDSPIEKKFFKVKSAVPDLSEVVVPGFGKNTSLRLKYVNVDKTPEKRNDPKDLPVFDQSLERTTPNVETALALLFGDESPKSTNQTPTRIRFSPRKLSLQMGEGLARSPANTPTRKSPRKLGSTVSYGGSPRKQNTTGLSFDSKLIRKAETPCSGEIRCKLSSCTQCVVDKENNGNCGFVMTSQAEVSLRYVGFRKERVVGQFANEYVIQICPGDSFHFWRKVHDVLTIVDGELGFPESKKEDVEEKTVYLYITDRRVVGCLVAEPLDVAHTVIHGMDGAVECSEKTRPVKVGVSRIWTLASFRRRRVATRLVSCLRAHFQFSTLLKHDQVAFSSPTMDGAMFARKYMKKNDYLVYQRDY